MRHPETGWDNHPFMRKSGHDSSSLLACLVPQWPVSLCNYYQILIKMNNQACLFVCYRLNRKLKKTFVNLFSYSLYFVCYEQSFLLLFCCIKFKLAELILVLIQYFRFLFQLVAIWMRKKKCSRFIDRFISFYAAVPWWICALYIINNQVCSLIRFKVFRVNPVLSRAFRLLLPV